MKHTRTLTLTFSLFGAGLLTTLAILPSARGGKVSAFATTTNTIYAESLAAGWENWSWGTTSNFAATQAHAGTKGISVTHTEGWSGLYLHHGGLSLAGMQTLEFWVHGGSVGNQTLYVYAEDASGRTVVQVPVNDHIEGGKVVANAWRKVTMPLSALKLGGQYALTGLTFQNGTDGSLGTYYLDDIVFTGDGTTPTPTPFSIPPYGPNAPAYPVVNPSGARPVGFPKNFALGVSSAPGGAAWMKATGAAWKMRYQYLAGGVNTGAEGWRGWNTPDGQFATNYLNESGNNAYIPVFTYYQMLHSNPRRFDESLDAYQEKLRTPTTMRPYFNDFKVLMQKCGAYGKTVIVHVEPDMWGYIQHVQSDPAKYPVSVASSGQVEAAGLPNNAVGFAQMLVRLQQRYAPKTILALHASSWSAGMDVTNNRDPQLNIAAQANATGAFLNKLGGGWGLIFVDIADRDAAYYQLVHNRNTWLDETDQKLPSFKQAHYWISRINQKTGRRIILWQVPIGNTKKRSVNNTRGHYQDNRVQYYLDGQYGLTHLRDITKSGVIGILFGRGDDNTTAHTDEAGDGVTNPAPINNNAGTATVSDDDGGYLQERARTIPATAVPIP